MKFAKVVPESLTAGTFAEVYDDIDSMLRGKVVQNENAEKQRITHAIIETAVFERVKFTKSKLAKLELTDVIFKNCDFSNCDLTNATLYRVEFYDCKLVGG
ncbi:pentapeptide repeat-containing protein [Lentilactobacillus senioris]|uniref:pentapeptide repeat-containing protein n=1 Tax=Lentilactobacillus senioris TaxID=931534 RepID=UPI0006D0C57E|nr:pentapeptide repeat-containing protein [Lentilactobacillus senioris]